MQEPHDLTFLVGITLISPIKFRWTWRGLCTGWSRGWPPWAVSRVFQQLPPPAQRRGLGGGLAWGHELSPLPDPESNRNVAWAGNELPIRGRVLIWLPHQQHSLQLRLQHVGGYALTAPGPLS